MHVQSYLFFEGRCEEAIAFYRQALGATDVQIKRYREAPACEDSPSMDMPPDKVMHAEFRVGDTVLLCSDGMCKGQPSFAGFSLAVSTTSDAETARFFEALAADGGRVEMPLASPFFSSSFGMVRDRFGVGWMLLTRPAGT